MKRHKKLFLTLISFFIVANTFAAENPIGACVRNFESPTRLESAISQQGSERLRRFVNLGSLRYSKDAEVLAFAKEIEERVNMETPVGDSFHGLTGILMLTKRQPTVVTADISAVRIATIVKAKKTSQEYGTRSETLNSDFVKFMTGFFIGADRLLEGNTRVGTFRIKSYVANESLANLLLDLGFQTPKFGRTVTREEIKYIIGNDRLPPSLKKPQGKQALKPKDDSEGEGESTTRALIPFELEITLP